MSTTSYSLTLTLLTVLVTGMGASAPLHAQTAMINVSARGGRPSTGHGNAIIDPTNIGEWRRVWREPIPERKTDFFEYAFDGARSCRVGDVAPDRRGSPAVAADRAGDRAGGGLVAIQDGDSGAARGEERGDGGADARTPAGDDGRLLLQLEHGSPVRRARCLYFPPTL
jgi:hypothetical protein